LTPKNTVSLQKAPENVRSALLLTIKKGIYYGQMLISETAAATQNPINDHLSGFICQLDCPADKGLLQSGICV